MFFDKTCKVSAVTYTTVWGASKRTYNTIYDGIECNFEQTKQWLHTRDYAENVGLPKYEVVLPMTYNQVRENQTIELIDPVLWSMWLFIIGSVNASPSIGGGIDCITLFAHAMKWQQ